MEEKALTYIDKEGLIKEVPTYVDNKGVIRELYWRNHKGNPAISSPMSENDLKKREISKIKGNLRAMKDAFLVN